MVRRGLQKRKLKNFFVARVHADQVRILKNLKGTMHDIIVCTIIFIFELLIVLGTDIFLLKVDFLKKILKIGFLDKTEWYECEFEF
jgi:hypothetical protein